MSELPHNENAERCLLGCYLLDPEQIGETEGTISQDDFYSEPHRIIYSEILNIYRSGRPVDLVPIQDDLKRSGQLEAVGGIQYVASLEQYVVTSASAPEYARMIHESARLRRLWIACRNVCGQIEAQEKEPAEILTDAESSIYQATQTDSTSSLVVTVGEGIGEVFDRHNRIARGDTPPGILSHFKDLDGILNGFRPGELIILAARTGIGKTSFALNIATQISKGSPLWSREQSIGLPTLFFSLEMSAQELSLRVASSLARLSGTHLRDGRIDLQRRSEFQQWNEYAMSLPLFFDDRASITVSQIRSRARRMKAKRPDLALLVVDYIQLVRPDAREKGRTRETEVAQISRDLKGLARELNIPILCLAQLSRESDRDGRPKLRHLRESGALEQDSDVVIFLHRPQSEDDENQFRSGNQIEQIELIVEKHRNGPTGARNLIFHPQFTTFSDASPTGRM